MQDPQGPDPPSCLVLNWQLGADFTFDPALITEVEVRFIADSDNATRVEREHRNLERLGDRGVPLTDRLPGGCGGLLQLFSRQQAKRSGKPHARGCRLWRAGQPLRARRSVVSRGETHCLGAVHRQRAQTKRDAHDQASARVPAFGDLHLYETQGILRYLDDVLPEPGLTPADPRSRARMSQIIGINHCYFFPKVAPVLDSASWVPRAWHEDQRGGGCGRGADGENRPCRPRALARPAWLQRGARSRAAA